MFHRGVMAWLAMLLPTGSAPGIELRADGHHVFPGDRIQEALDAAARHATNKAVKVHAGVYRPENPRLALLWLHRQHDGVRLQAVGRVTLSAANPAVSDPRSPSYPAVVNHVVYLGDGLSARTVVEGFTITGANHFVSTNAPEVIEPNARLEKGLFFYCDGGAVKVFGRSYPTLRRLEIVDNYASPCAGGISVEHDGHGEGLSPEAVRIEDCVFRNNRAQVTGAAVDLLPGSQAVLTNCLFVGNLANTGVNFIDPNRERPAFTNSASLTVFAGSRAMVWRCTFTGNRNGADDLGQSSVYRDCIFWGNDQPGGFYTNQRYDLDLQGRATVTGCFFGGRILDRHGVVSSRHNFFQGPDPQWDDRHVPSAPPYQKAGYRPVP